MGIRFLEQLAPARAGSTPSAYAPVPPLFAPSLTTPDLEEEHLSLASSRDADVQSSSVKSHTFGTTPATVAGHAQPAVEHALSPGAPRSELVRDVVPGEASTPTRVIMRAATTTTSSKPSPGAPTRRGESSTVAPNDDGPRARVPAPSLLESGPSQPMGEASSAAIVRSPLRERPMMHVSASPRAEPQPVVHVTIDRIEVRAPAAQPPAPASRPKASTPSSKSLSDYLAERNRAGGATP